MDTISKRLAWLLDNSIRIPGTRFRFGLDAIIGLVPGLGDLIGTALSLYIVGEAWRAGISKRTLTHMLLNVAIEGVFGAVPILGDFFDAVWKANQRNVRLLEAHARDPQHARRASGRFFLLLIGILLALLLSVGALIYFIMQGLRAL